VCDDGQHRRILLERILIDLIQCIRLGMVPIEVVLADGAGRSVIAAITLAVLAPSNARMPSAFHRAHTQMKNIRPRIDILFPLQLLRSHVLQGAKELSPAPVKRASVY